MYDQFRQKSNAQITKSVNYTNHLRMLIFTLMHIRTFIYKFPLCQKITRCIYVDLNSFSRGNEL